MILAERLVEVSGEGEESRELEAAEALLRTLGDLTLLSATVCRGSLLTVGDVVCSARQKLELGSRYGADGVDMESFAVFSAALRRQVP